MKALMNGTQHSNLRYKTLLLKNHWHWISSTWNSQIQLIRRQYRLPFNSSAAKEII